VSTTLAVSLCPTTPWLSGVLRRPLEGSALVTVVLMLLLGGAIARRRRRRARKSGVVLERNTPLRDAVSSFFGHNRKCEYQGFSATRFSLAFFTLRFTSMFQNVNWEHVFAYR